MHKERFVIKASDVSNIAEIFLKQEFSVQTRFFSPFRNGEESRCELYFWRDYEMETEMEMLKNENAKLRNELMYYKQRLDVKEDGNENKSGFEAKDD